MMDIQQDRRIGDIMQRITLAGVVLTMLIQISAGIWWASEINTITKSHDKWIKENSPVVMSIAVLDKRVCNLEENTNRLIVKLDIIAELITNERIERAKLHKE